MTNIICFVKSDKWTILIILHSSHGVERHLCLKSGTFITAILPAQFHMCTYAHVHSSGNYLNMFYYPKGVNTIFNRPGVAGAVLQSPLSLINWLIQSVSHTEWQISKTFWFWFQIWHKLIFLFSFWVGTSPYQDFFLVPVSILIMVSHNAIFGIDFLP